MRLPVRLAIALDIAGATIAMPNSPTPEEELSVLSTLTSIAGISLILMIG